MNELEMYTTKPEALNQVYNTAVGEYTTLLSLFNQLKEVLTAYDPTIADINPQFGPERLGDIPHSLASIEKAKQLLGYTPKRDVKNGLNETIKWYRESLRLEGETDS